MKNKTIKLLAIMLSCVLTICIMTANCYAVVDTTTTYPHLSKLYFLDITSYSENNESRTESFPVYSGLNDHQVVTVSEHYRDVVEIRYRQEGYTGDDTITLEGGTKMSGYTYDPVSGYIPETGRYGEIAWSNYQRFIDIDPNLSESDCVINALVMDGEGVLHSYTQTLTIRWADDRPAAPANVSFVYNPLTDKMTLQNVDSTMEYRLSTASEDAWLPCTTGMELDVPTSKKTYYVRYAATESASESQSVSVILASSASAPSCTYNRTTELVSGLTSEMEISFNDGAYAPYTGIDGTFDMDDYVTAIPSDSTLTVNIRKSATSTNPPSKVKSITINPRLATPTSLVFDNINVKVTGASSSMQYKLSTQTSWTSISSSQVSFLNHANTDAEITVSIRKTYTTTNSASLPIVFTIPKLSAGPAGTIDYINETITGLNDNVAYEYSTSTNPTNTSTSWDDVDVVDGTFDISDIVTTSQKTVNIRTAATTTSPVSDYTTFTLEARASAPSASFVYNNDENYDKAVLTGITSDMEYRKSTDSEWTSISGTQIVFDLPSSNATYYVRTKADIDDFASVNKTLTLKKSSSAPSCSYSTTTEKLTSVSTSMEISYNGSAYEAITASSMDMAEIVDDIPSGETMVIKVRTAATETSPASAAKTITLYSRAITPTTVVYNPVAISMTGTASTMQYRVSTASSWTSISGTTVSLLPKVSSEEDVIVYVRYKPTSTKAASRPVIITVPKLLAGPVAEISYISEQLVGLDDSIAYEYTTVSSPAVNSTSWTDMSVVNGGFDISGILSSSSTKTISIRKAATATAPITYYTTISLPKRGTAPSVSFVYNDANNTDKAVLSGLTTDMEYRLSSETTWTPVTGEVVLDIPTSSLTYYVRYKSTETAFASANKSCSLSKRGTAPSVTYSSSTHIISKLTSSMEIKIGDAAEYTPIPSGTTTYDLTDLLTENGGSLTVYVRKSATASAPASKDKVISATL